MTQHSQIPPTEDFAALARLWQSTTTNDSLTLNNEAIIAHIATIAPLEHNAAPTAAKRSSPFSPLSERTSFMQTLMAILQNRERFIQSILAKEHLRLMAVALLAISCVSFFVYGFVLGLQHSLLQALSSAVKLPVLFLLTIIITFPTLFIFGSLIGIGRTFMQTVVILLGGTAIISLALVALSPVTLLFGMTTSSYAFFKLLNVGIFVVAWFLGAAFFRAIYAPPVSTGAVLRVHHAGDDDDEATVLASSQALSEEQAENHTKVQAYFIRFWFLLYGFVAVQISWMLRPFVCSSSLEFQLLRGLRDNVYGDILYSIAHILGLR
ncbi:MAG: hypothetical protein H9535_05405 [Ignavibacteria bacterium]|nr:hypothetical protein [Ignavibacteria bacterium]